MKHIALFLAAASATTIFGCGGEDNPTRTPDESGTSIEGSTPSEGEESPSPSCKEDVTCGDPVADPDPEVQPDPAEDPTPEENPPQPVADPCDEFPWLEEAIGRFYQCYYPSGRVADDSCVFAVVVADEGTTTVCEVECRPLISGPAMHLAPLENGAFRDNIGDNICRPTNVEPQPSTNHPCAEFPWLDAASSQYYQCYDASGRAMEESCYLEPKEYRDQCEVDCSPLFSGMASELIPVENGFSYSDNTCFPLN